MRELFVYYRVQPGHVAAARRAVLAMQEALRTSFPNLQARLLSRDGADGAPTWMETYAQAGADAGIGADAVQAIADRAAVLEPFTEGGRHVEVFFTLDPT